METIIIGNIILILCIAALGFFFGPDRERWSAAFFAGVISFQLSFFGWVVYVAVHFITKYW